MKFITKNKNLFIALILFVALSIASLFAAIFIKPTAVNAAENYGDFDAKGYYSVDGVIFYAIRVKNVKYFGEGETSITINTTRGDTTVKKSEIFKKTDGTYGYLFSNVEYVVDLNLGNNATNISSINFSYYPNYDLSLDNNGKIQYVTYGETVLLDEGESLMLSFARQEGSKAATEHQALENALIMNGLAPISDYVDFLSMSVKFNNKAPVTDAPTSDKVEDNITKKYFGYIVDPYNKETLNEEGLVQLSVNFEHESVMKNFGFSFYMFKKSTYQRTETLNSLNGFSRPSSEIEVPGGNYVIDKLNANKYYSEYFYNYQDKGLATLTYNPERYEVTINKIIHSATTEYNFSYDAVNGKVLYSNTPSPATSPVYARDIAISNRDASGNVTLTLKDIGVYEISYKAVYFNAADNSKVYLETLNNNFSKKDCLTIFGVQTTYSNYQEQQSEFRNGDNTIAADVTKVFSATDIADILTKEPSDLFKSDFTIASTNQPPVAFLTNSSFASNEASFTVYYAEKEDGTFVEQLGYNVASYITKAGYYFICATNSFANFKEWLGGTSNNKTEISTQYFFFRIKDQTPLVNVQELNGETASGIVMSGSYDASGNYNGSFVKNSIYLPKLEENSEFDLPTSYSLERRVFGSDSTPNASSWQTVSINSLENVLNGYKISENGHYRLTINFGNSSSIKRYFDIDKTGIEGVKAYNVQAISGTSSFSVLKNAMDNSSKIFATSSPFTVMWNNKASGAKISANYVRYAMEAAQFSDDANNYKLGDKVAANSKIVINLNNPETLYEKAASTENVLANQVLTLPGLYIFELVDEAGNAAYFSIILDNSTPVILQSTYNKNGIELETFEIINQFNNISSDTRVFWGTHKAVQIKLAEGANERPLTSLEIEEEIKLNNPLTRYIESISENLINSRFEVIGSGENASYFATFAITSASGAKLQGNDEINQGVTGNNHVINVVIDNETGTFEDAAYRFEVIDESGNKKYYSVTVNTDKTGMSIYTIENSELKDLKATGFKTDRGNADKLSTKIGYYNSTNAKVLYLTWETLTPEIEAFVNLTKGGLQIKYYELVYNAEQSTFEYQEVPTTTFTITEEMIAYSNGKVQIPINVVNGETLAGKYEIVRKYSAKNGTEDVAELNTIVGTDYVVVSHIFYVDRNPIISAPSGNQTGSQVGGNAYINVFDGVNGSEIKFEELFKQSQSSSNAVIETNKLPIGIYIPIAKYGYLQGGTQFIDNTKVELNGNKYYSPFKLYVTLTSPTTANGDKVVYYYTKADANGYFVLDSYSVNGGNLIKINNGTNTLTNNGLGDTKYITGNYRLDISALITEEKEYLQNFYFILNVIGDEPKFDVVGQYPNLPNMGDKELSTGDLGYLYSNADQLLISWKDFENEFRVNIDETKIWYKFNNSTKVENSNGAFNIVNNSFTIPVNANASTLTIHMEFEVYGQNTSLQKFFPNSKYSLEKTIIFDRQAPNATVNKLIAGDVVLNTQTGTGNSALRIEGDRFNISTQSGIYRYFSYVTTNDFLKNNLFNYTSNISNNTSLVYIRSFNNKYGSSAIEIGSPLNSASTPSNVFDIQLAETDTDTWKKFTKDNISGIELTSGYYEIVELDLAGNTTIYSVYIAEEGATIEASYNYRETENSLANKKIELVSQNTINSREVFALTSLTYKHSSYGYIRLLISGTEYLITPFNEIYNVRSQNAVNLSDIVLTSRNNLYLITVYDSVNSKFTNKTVAYNINVSVADFDASLEVSVGKNYATVGDSVYLLLNYNTNSSIQLKELTIYALLNNEKKMEYTYGIENIADTIKTTIVGNNIIYYITPNVNWDGYTFWFIYKDNFGRTSSAPYIYNQINFNRYESVVNNDINASIQASNNIVVSDDLIFNETNLYKVEIEKRVGNNVQFSKVTDVETILNGSYTGYKLPAMPMDKVNAGYRGGVVVYKLTLTQNLESLGLEGLETTLQEKVIYVTIYNQMPDIMLRNANGEDITDGLKNKTITHSDDVYISFNGNNDISTNYGYTPKVLARLRGSSEGYYEITSPYTLSTPGTYDITVQNYKDGQALAKVYEFSFMIASYDVNFYSVVKYDSNNIENPYQVIEPTGKIYTFGTKLVNYHYILNTNTYEISVNNGVEAILEGSESEGSYTTYLYLVRSKDEGAGSSVKFSRYIAITVIPETNNILGGSLSYFLGENSEAVEVVSIDSANKDVYVYETDTQRSITLRWNPYYGVTSNIIYYQISRDGGTTWTGFMESYDKNNGFMTYNFDKSGNYVIRFVDLAGNTQTITSSSGTRDRYRINFIKSVIFLVNGETPIDNAVYNGDVVVSIPSGTKSYYQANPQIVVTLNGEEYKPSLDENKNYLFTEPGNYEVYFTARKNNNNLGVERVAFTIINENDSRWAFTYHNYHNYIVNYIKYNGTDLVFNVKDLSEIIMSVVMEDALFDNGVYTISMSTNEIPIQTFEFSFWLNNATPDITISLEEGATTTGNIEVKFNAENIYDMVGDCTIYINGSVIADLNAEYFESDNFEANISRNLTEVSEYYIQVFTSTGKLIYSYRVEIVEPLNTMAIILIVVACVVVAVGILLFVLLRKKLKIK